MTINYGKDDTPVATEIQYGANDKPADAKPVGFMRKAADLGLGFVSGALGSSKSVSDAAGAGNAVSGALDTTDKFVQSRLSDQAITDQQKQQAILKDAEGKGAYEGVKAAGRAFAVAPVQTAVTGLGSVVPTILAGFATGGASVPVSLGAMAAMGAAQGAGSIKGGIYDDIKQRSDEAKMDPAAAEAAALKAQEYGGPNTGQIALGAALGTGDSVTGVSKIATSMLRKGIGKGAQELAEGSARGIVARTALGVAGEVPLEAAQGGQQQYASNVASQREGFAVDPWDNVVSQGAFEGLASAVPGAAFGALNGRAAPVVPEAAPGEPAPAPEPTPPGLDFNPTAGTSTVFPDGSVILNSESANGEQAVFDKRFAPQPVIKPSEAMGLDANAGALSAAAVVAVDTGAHDTAVLQQAQDQIQAQAQAGKGQAATENVAPNAPATAPNEAPGLIQAAQAAAAPGMAAQTAEWEAAKQANIARYQAENNPAAPTAAPAVAPAPDVPAPAAIAAPTPQERLAKINSEIASGADGSTGAKLTPFQLGIRKAQANQITSQLPKESVDAAQPQDTGTQAGPATGAQGAAQATAATGSAIAAPSSNGAELQTDDDARRAEILKSQDGLMGSTRAANLNYMIEQRQGDLRNLQGRPLDNPVDHQEEVSRLTQEIGDYQAILPAAQQADRADQRSGIDRTMLQGAKAELDVAVASGDMTQQQAKDAIEQAQSTGNAVSASDAIFNAVDSTAQPQGLLNAKTDEAITQPAQPEAGPAAMAGAAGQVAPKLNPIQATAIAKQKGIDTTGMKPAQVLAAIALANAAPGGPVQLGRNNQPLSEGGKPYKTRLAASDAKKLQPMMRVISVKDGFVLAEKTEKQLAAEQKAARRLRNPQTSAPGEPIPAHAFIASEGGLHKDTRPDMNIGANPKVGNRMLFAGQDKGLSMERATARLIEEGYLSEGATHSDAAALIKKSLTNPQYNADGIERMAIADEEARYAAYELEMENAIAEVESVDDNEFSVMDDSDIPFGDEPSNTTAEAAMTALGFTEQEIRDEVTANESRVAQADSQSRGGPVQTTASDAQAGDGQRATAQGQEQGLTAPSQQDVLDQQDRAEAAAKSEKAQQRAADEISRRERERKDIAKASESAADSFVLGGNAEQNLSGQGGMFDDAPAAAPAPKAEAKSAEPAAQPSKPANAKIADFGEKIGGAKKDTWTSFKDNLNSVKDEDIAAQSLSKIWPAPDYQQLIDGGMDSEAIGLIRAFRDEIPNKPRQGYKVKRWAEQVKTLRELANSLMDGKTVAERVRQEMADGSDAMRGMFGRAELYEEVGHEKSLEGIRLAWHSYSFYKGEKNVSLWVVERDAAATAFSNWPQELATGKTKEEAIAEFKARYDALDTEKAVKQASFDVITERGKQGYFIGKKVGRNHATLAGPFPTVKEARDYRTSNLAELQAKLEKFKEIPRERRDTNEPRVGEDMRNGQDVTQEFFGQTFGFKGVEFGNWVEQTRRQKDLNSAFDALMDMAAVLGIPPKAISLDGKLGLAFGARGSGGVSPAAAHYEPGKVVINLTKKEGAGSLGHEWWHALDNYFSKQRGKGEYMTNAVDVGLSARGSNYVAYAGVRKEMIDAFGAVVKAINLTAMKARSSKLDSKRSKEYWGTGEELSARAFESYLIAKLQDQNGANDYLANVVSQKAWDAMASMGMENENSYPYPTADEIPAIRAGFDHLFDTVQTKEGDVGNMAMFSRPDQDATTGTAKTVRAALAKRFGLSILQMEKRGFLKIWDTTAQFNESGQSSRQIEGAAQGMWDGKMVHLFADGITPGNEVAVLLHEVGEHASMQKMLGPEAYKRLVARAHELMRADDPTALEAVMRIPDDTPKKFLDSELLAYMIEIVAAQDAKTSPGARKWLADVVAAIRAWWSQTSAALKLRDYGIRMELTPKDIAALAVRAVKWQGRQDEQPARSGQEIKTQTGSAMGALKFSRATESIPESASKLSIEHVTQLVQKALGGIRNAPPIEVVSVVAETGLDAPEGVMGITARDGRCDGDNGPRRKGVRHRFGSQ